MGGTGKAEDEKLPGAGIIPKLCPGECAAKKGYETTSVRIDARYGTKSAIKERVVVQSFWGVTRDAAVRTS